MADDTRLVVSGDQNQAWILDDAGTAVRDLGAVMDASMAADGRLQEILRNGYVTVSLPIETFSKEAAALGVSEVPTLMLLKPDGKTISILTSDTLLDAQATKAALEGALKEGAEGGR